MSQTPSFDYTKIFTSMSPFFTTTTTSMPKHDSLLSNLRLNLDGDDSQSLINLSSGGVNHIPNLISLEENKPFPDSLFRLNRKQESDQVSNFSVNKYFHQNNNNPHTQSQSHQLLQQYPPLPSSSLNLRGGQEDEQDLEDCFGFFNNCDFKLGSTNSQQLNTTNNSENNNNNEEQQQQIQIEGIQMDIKDFPIVEEAFVLEEPKFQHEYIQNQQKQQQQQQKEQKEQQKQQEQQELQEVYISSSSSATSSSQLSCQFQQKQTNSLQINIKKDGFSYQKNTICQCCQKQIKTQQQQQQLQQQEEEQREQIEQTDQEEIKEQIGGSRHLWKVTTQIMKDKKKKIRHDYDKNICRYIARQCVRSFVDRLYKDTVLQFCGGNSELYQDCVKYFLAQIECITGHRAFKDILSVDELTKDSKTMEMKMIFRRFCKWFLQERAVRYIMCGNMTNKRQYIRYKNQVMLHYIDRPEQWNSNQTKKKEIKVRKRS